MSAFVERVQQFLHPTARVPAGMEPRNCEPQAYPFAAMGGREHQWHACHQVETRETSKARTAFTTAIYPRESSHSRGSPETIPPHLSCLPMLTSPLRRNGCCFYCICDRTPPRGGNPGQVKCDGRCQPPIPWVIYAGCGKACRHGENTDCPRCGDCNGTSESCRDAPGPSLQSLRLLRCRRNT
jgi:hypothetical protein